MAVLRNYLKRHTDLSFLLDYLMTQRLVLLNPLSWDDKNDSYFMAHYEKLNGNLAVYALFLTESSETYHHWRVFASGSSGVCIDFNKEKLLQCMGRSPDIRAERVNYKQIKYLRSQRPSQEQLPFLKRAAFSDEKEFRLFSAAEGKQQDAIRM